MKNIFLANMIYIFHILVILFVLFAPLLNYTNILILHITFCISLLVHWLANSNECSLSRMESYFRGIDNTCTFSHQFIAPIYDISQTNWDTVCYLIVFLTLSISLYRLFSHPKMTIFKDCYKKGDYLQDKLSCFSILLSP
jgi:hypothetical protein